MPSVSRAQQAAAAIALHHPEKLYTRNRGLLDVKDLSKFARTKTKGLPWHVKKNR